MLMKKMSKKTEYADDDKTLQAQYKLSGLCKHCGADPKNTRRDSFAKHRGLCMECFFYDKTHNKDA